MKEARELENIKVDEKYVNPFNFKKIGSRYLLTNDIGQYVFLELEDFKGMLKGELDKSTDVYSELWRKGFLKRDLSEYEAINSQYADSKRSLFSGPGLHIIVVTLRCNQNCIYCQAQAKGMKDKSLDMDRETAKKAVDSAFSSPRDTITIEFQGGEPLANWDVVKYIVEYARKKEEETKKTAVFSLVSNLSLMDEEKFNFCIENMVGLCTSLDGPKELHNKNRPFPGGDSYEDTARWVKKYQERRVKERRMKREITNIGALATITKESLSYPKEIINEYLSMGFRAIHLRPVSYLGYSSGKFRDQMGYNIDDFLIFWEKSVEHIINLNNSGTFFMERGLQIMLAKIITRIDPGYTDLSSPCGAVIGQVLYDYNGDIYTCDEGRMLDDDTFKIGNLNNCNYENIISSDVTQAVVTASILENQGCDMCVYKPYCGVCPVKNYSQYGTLFPAIRDTEWCKYHMRQFDYIFENIDKKRYKGVFESWVEMYKQSKLKEK